MFGHVFGRGKSQLIPHVLHRLKNLVLCDRSLLELFKHRLCHFCKMFLILQKLQHLTPVADHHLADAHLLVACQRICLQLGSHQLQQVNHQGSVFLVLNAPAAILIDGCEEVREQLGVIRWQMELPPKLLQPSAKLIFVQAVDVGLLQLIETQLEQRLQIGRVCQKVTDLGSICHDHLHFFDFHGVLLQTLRQSLKQIPPHDKKLLKINEATVVFVNGRVHSFVQPLCSISITIKGGQPQ
mmetsp:Transcript_70485/g.117732  ORF Transcript_70485/g.117732 Transcript_70485/m.117732 type:complete len:240 (+) Transcript_70485:1588-2307(+)